MVSTPLHSIDDDYDGLLVDLNCPDEIGNDNPVHILPEPLPDPTPPETVGNPEQVIIQVMQ